MHAELLVLPFLFCYYSFTGVDSVSLQVTSLLYVHGIIMMSPLF